MKKIFASLMALLLLSGVSFAASIPTAIEPNAGGPEVWIQSVYTVSALDVGDVVVSDIYASTGDDDNWVETTTTADTYLVVGVVYPSDIAAGTIGTIAIRGPVQADWGGVGVGAVNSLACTSTTAGSAGNCVTDAANFGLVTQAAASNSAI